MKENKRFIIHGWLMRTSAHLHICTFFFVFIANVSFSQNTNCPKSQNKKAVKAYEEAEGLFKGHKDWDKARSLVENAIDEDPDFADAYLLQGKMAEKKKDDKAMEQSYLKAIELCPDL